MKPVLRNLISPAFRAAGLLLAVGIAAVSISLLWSKKIVPAHDIAEKKIHWTKVGYRQTFSIPVSVIEREYPKVYHHPFPQPCTIIGGIPESPNTKQLNITIDHCNPGNNSDRPVVTDRIMIVLKNEDNEWRYGAWSVQTENGHAIPDRARTAFAFRPDPNWLKMADK